MQKRFRNESIRLRNWDYGSQGSYFITMCTQNRVHYFGEIVNDKMILTESGKIAEELFNEIPKRFRFAKVDSLVIMPNHIHSIISIVKSWESSEDFEKRRAQSKSPLDLNVFLDGGITGSKNPMLNENVSRIIRWFKGRCSFEIRKVLDDFKWQSRFYDRIIWTKQSYSRVKRYIENNVKNWQKDKMSQ